MNVIIICNRTTADEISLLLGEKVMLRQDHRDNSAIKISAEYLELLPEMTLSMCVIVKEDGEISETN